MMPAYLHSLRRSLLNRYLLLLLAVTLLVSLDIGYRQASSVQVAQRGPGYYLIAETLHNASGAYFTGVVLSSSGSPVAGARVFYVGPGGHEEVAVTNASGYFIMASAQQVANVTVEVHGRNYTLSPASIALVGVNLASRRAVLAFAAPQVPGVLCYRAYVFLTSTPPQSATIITYLGEYGPGVHEVAIRLWLHMPLLVLNLEPVTAANDTGARSNVTYSLILASVMADAERTSTLANAVGVVAVILPLAGAFLVDDLFARPRATRAIELVLARPIKKPELFLHRYLGGLSALAISAAAASAALGLTSSLLLGLATGPSACGVIYGSLLASLAGFYSTLYLVATLTRRHFLWAAALIYAALYLMGPGLLLVASSGTWWALYLSPFTASFGALEAYLGAMPYVLLSRVSAADLAAAAATWAAAPAITSALIYLRIDEA